MRTTLCSLFVIGACILLVSCSTVGDQDQALKQAAYRFAALKEAGKLPGFAPADHGELQSQAFPLNHKLTYPATVMIYATRENDLSNYTYTFTKENASSDWQLTAAWRTLQNGHREDLKIE
jgi:hypothetical protein